MRKLLAAISVLVLAGCAGGGGSSTPTPPSSPSVDWSSYPSSLQQFIDEAEANGDCVELQGYFDTWIEVAGATDVASYVDASLESAGCYD